MKIRVIYIGDPPDAQEKLTQAFEMLLRITFKTLNNANNEANNPDNVSNSEI